MGALQKPYRCKQLISGGVTWSRPSIWIDPSSLGLAPVTGRGLFALAVKQREHDKQSRAHHASLDHEDDNLPRRQAREKRFHHTPRLAMLTGDNMTALGLETRADPNR